MITTLNRSIIGSRSPRHEIQANRFAATLLIDHRALRQEFTARFDGVVLSQLLHQMRAREAPDRGRLLAGYSDSGSPSLATLFVVSIEAMAITLETRGYLQDMPVLFST